MYSDGKKLLVPTLGECNNDMKISTMQRYRFEEEKRKRLTKDLILDILATV